MGKPYVHVVHLGLDEDQYKKLRFLALRSRRTQLGVLRLLLDDATPEQLGVRQPEEKPA